MKIPHAIRRHIGFVQLVMDLLLMLIASFYANRVTHDELWNLLGQFRLIQFVSDSGKLNLLLVIACSIVFCRYKISGSLSEANRKEAIEHLLHASARALVFPSEKVRIRAFCHLADTKTKELLPYCSWSPHQDTDSDVRVPYEGSDSSIFVIAKAFKRRHVIAEELPPNHLDQTPQGIRDMVWKDIRCVLAAPIRDFSKSDSEILGTISFDTSQPLSSIKFDTPSAKDICVLYARAIYDLLKG